MQWIVENWLLLLLGGGMIAIHLFGHGHGKNGSHDHANHRTPLDEGIPVKDGKYPSKGDTDA